MSLLNVNSIGGLTGGFGFRNRLINAQGLINQRAYVSGTATTVANQYTLDRWRVVTLGQNLTYTTSQNETTFTAPAGGVEQVIEGLNLETGTYVLSWTGTATATVGGSAVANGGTVSVTGGTNTTVRFSSGTFKNPQFESGNRASTFERRPVGFELSLCERYYQRIYNWTGLADTTSAVAANVSFRARMRAAPTITKIENSTLTFRLPNSDRSSTTWGINAAISSDTAVWFQITNLSSLTAGQATHNRLQSANDIAQADAEL
jgi:hypothetical protein